MLKIMLVVGLTVVAGSAFADEVIIHRDDAPPPPTSKTVVEHHDAVSGCESKTVHKENGMGDATTVKKSDC